MRRMTIGVFSPSPRTASRPSRDSRIGCAGSTQSSIDPAAEDSDRHLTPRILHSKLFYQLSPHALHDLKDAKVRNPQYAGDFAIGVAMLAPQRQNVQFNPLDHFIDRYIGSRREAVEPLQRQVQVLQRNTQQLYPFPAPPIRRVRRYRTAFHWID